MPTSALELSSALSFSHLLGLHLFRDDPLLQFTKFNYIHKIKRAILMHTL